MNNIKGKEMEARTVDRILLVIAITAMIAAALIACSSGGKNDSEAFVPAGGESQESIRPANPVIVKFYSEPEYAAPGVPVEIFWEVIGADRIEMSAAEYESQDVPTGFSFESSESSGSTTIEEGVAADTVFTLTAFRRWDETEISSTHEMVVSVPTIVIAPGYPIIESFYADPSDISAGETTNVCWSVINAERIELRWASIYGSDEGSTEGAVFETCITTSPLYSTTDFTLTAYSAVDPDAPDAGADAISQVITVEVADRS